PPRQAESDESPGTELDPGLAHHLAARGPTRSSRERRRGEQDQERVAWLAEAPAADAAVAAAAAGAAVGSAPSRGCSTAGGRRANSSAPSTIGDRLRLTMSSA